MKQPILIVVGILIIIAACFFLFWKKSSTPNQIPTADMTQNQQTFVLVHGAFADEHAWDAVKPLLEASGATVVTVNLPGHGTSTTSPKDITFKTYVDAVEAAVSAQQGSIILVGHSMAGMVVSQVAEDMPAKIKELVYVSAYLPANGQSLQDLANTDTGNLIAKNLVLSKDYTSATIKKEAVAEAVCADCPGQIQTMLAQSIKPEPLQPFGEKVTLSPENFGAVKKVYFYTTNDKAVTYDLQKRMVAANGTITETYSFDTSHLSFVVQPQKFADTLLQLK